MGHARVLGRCADAQEHAAAADEALQHRHLPVVQSAHAVEHQKLVGDRFLQLRDVDDVGRVVGFHKGLGNARRTKDVRRAMDHGGPAGALRAQPEVFPLGDPIAAGFGPPHLRGNQRTVGHGIRPIDPLAAVDEHAGPFLQHAVERLGQTPRPQPQGVGRVAGHRFVRNAQRRVAPHGQALGVAVIARREPVARLIIHVVREPVTDDGRGVAETDQAGGLEPADQGRKAAAKMVPRPGLELRLPHRVPIAELGGGRLSAVVAIARKPLPTAVDPNAVRIVTPDDFFQVRSHPIVEVAPAGTGRAMR